MVPPRRRRRRNARKTQVAFLIAVLGTTSNSDGDTSAATKYAVVVAKLETDDAAGEHALPRAFCPPCGRKPPAKVVVRRKHGGRRGVGGGARNATRALRTMVAELYASDYSMLKSGERCGAGRPP